MSRIFRICLLQHLPLQQVGNDLDIVFTAPSTAVPEPGTWAAAALLIGGSVLARWRKGANS